MDIDALQIQIFVSLMLVLGALFVALVCDFLKGNNEALREQTIELIVRQEERSRRGDVATIAPSAVPEQAQQRTVAPPLTAPPPQKPPFLPERPVTAPPRHSKGEPPLAERLLERRESRVRAQANENESAAVVQKEPRPEPLPPNPPRAAEPPPPPRLVEAPTAADPTEVKPRRNSVTMSAKVMPIDALERSRLTESPLEPEVEAPAESSVEQPSPAEKVLEEAAGIVEQKDEPAAPEIFLEEAVTETQVAATDAADAVPAETLTPEQTVSVAETETESASLVEEHQHSETDLEPDIAADLEQEALSLPSGMREAVALDDALLSTSPFRGTVIAVGFSRGKSRPAGKALDPLETTRAVEKLIESLLTERDTAFQCGEDEYLLALPDEHGPKAQRRLQYVSESLWDYQIRSVGVSSILFYWGSAEGHHELFSAVVAAAKERMYQTKRTRERPPSEIHHYRMNIVRS